MRKLIAILLSCVALVSCDNDNDELTLTMNESGTLKVNVVDENNNSLSGAIIKMSVYNGVDDCLTLTEIESDASGECYYPAILQGNYVCLASYEIDNKLYFDEKITQVIADHDTEITLSPKDNIGDVKIHFVYEYSDIPIQNLNVVLVNYKVYYGNQYFLEEMLSQPTVVGVTDSEGWVSFKDLPSTELSSSYRCLVYLDGGEPVYPQSNYFSVVTGEERVYELEVNL